LSSPRTVAQERPAPSACVRSHFVAVRHEQMTSGRLRAFSTLSNCQAQCVAESSRAPRYRRFSATSLGTVRRVFSVQCGRNRSAAAQLCAVDDEQGELHGRAQAREFARCVPAPLKGGGFRIVVIHDARPVHGPSATTPPEARKEAPGRTGGCESSPEHLPDQLHLGAAASAAVSRDRRGLQLSYREHFARLTCLIWRSRLSLLFPPNSGKRFTKVGIDAARVTERMVKNGFHQCPQSKRYVMSPEALTLSPARCVPGVR
jgi:hypothetical protein